MRPMQAATPCWWICNQQVKTAAFEERQSRQTYAAFASCGQSSIQPHLPSHCKEKESLSPWQHSSAMPARSSLHGSPGLAWQPTQHCWPFQCLTILAQVVSCQLLQSMVRSGGVKATGTAALPRYSRLSSHSSSSICEHASWNVLLSQLDLRLWRFAADPPASRARAQQARE